MILIVCSKCDKHMWNPKKYYWGKNRRPICPDCRKKEK